MLKVFPQKNLPYIKPELILMCQIILAVLRFKLIYSAAADKNIIADYSGLPGKWEKLKKKKPRCLKKILPCHYI